MTTLGSVLVLGGGFALAAYVYHKSYKHLQLRKMANAFQPGDPVLELAANRKDMPDPDAENWIPRPEQAKIDRIIHGEGKGHYFLIMGEKGSGKSSSKCTDVFLLTPPFYRSVSIRVKSGSQACYWVFVTTSCARCLALDRQTVQGAYRWLHGLSNWLLHATEITNQKISSDLGGNAED